MKRCMLIVFIAIVAVSLFGTACLAQLDRTVADTAKKGSLLVWPLIKVNSATSTNTTIKLSNDYYQSVKVKCFYRYAFPYSDASWVFTLMPNQQVSWVASTGKSVGKSFLNAMGSPPAVASGKSATLKCWAVNDAETNGIAWNWLAGEAIVYEPNNAAWEYSAWRFAVNSSTTGADAGAAYKLQLSGDSGNYDSCPTALLFNFMKQAPSGSDPYPKGTVNNVLTLVTCGDNFASNTNNIVSTEMKTRDEYGNSSSGTWICVGCGTSATQWFSEPLTSSKLHNPPSGNPFVNLASPGGTIYIHGKQDSTKCAGSVGMPLVGVMSVQFGSSTGPYVGEAPTAIGPGQAYLKDANDVYTSEAVSITWN